MNKIEKSDQENEYDWGDKNFKLLVVTIGVFLIFDLYIIFFNK